MMNDFFGSVWWLLVTLGLLITFHELGHYWVARLLGVKVLRFSVGFGKPLWSKIDRSGTEFAIAAIPLGGYVKMLDEREAEVAPAEAHRAFNRKSVWARIAITAAGPVANICFTVFAFWLMFVIGKPDSLPIVDQPRALAAQAGFEKGDRILRIGDDPVNAWSEVSMILIDAGIARKDLSIGVRTALGDETTRILPLSRISEELDEQEAIRSLGLQLRDMPAIVGEAVAGKPAQKAGLSPGDRIVAVNGVPIESFTDLYGIVQKEAAKGEPLKLAVDRKGQQLAFELKAEAGKDANSKPNHQIGIRPQDPRDTILRYGPLAAIPVAMAETWRMSVTTLAFMKHMLVGAVSLKNVSGAIGIAQTANESAKLGVAWFLSFLALLSLSIGILNLLPIPILDGGHLLYYLIEIIKGSPVSERVMVMGQYVGLTLLLSLIGLAFYNDISRIIS